MLKLFIKSLHKDTIILCPSAGIDWDGTYEHLARIIKQYCSKNKDLIPFTMNLANGNTLIFGGNSTPPDAIEHANFFLFDPNKGLIGSSILLNELFTQYQESFCNTVTI